MKAVTRMLYRITVCMLCILCGFLVLPSATGRLHKSDTVTGPGSNTTQMAVPKSNVNQSDHPPILLTPNLRSSSDYGEDDPITGRSCSNEDIVIIQGPTAPLPNGVPTYTVEIMNACVSGCSICNIHVTCGWFSSARLIDPNVFMRLSYDDCLVNGGDPLHAGETISFQYADTYDYPLSVSSVTCC